MLSRIVLGTNHLFASRRFYDAVMPTLGYACEDAGDSYAGYGLTEHIGSGQNCLWLGLPANGEAANSGNGTNVALLAQSRKQVDSFYSAALAAGASYKGAPGLRDVPSFLRVLCQRPRWPQVGGRLPSSRGLMLHPSLAGKISRQR